MIERTLAIIKPHAVAAKNTGAVIGMIEKRGFDIVCMQKTHLTAKQAEEFYAIHKEKPFFGGLVGNVTSGPAILMVLEKENAIQDWRDFMGATDPLKAEPGTIRKLFGESIDFNVAHGSDSPENAIIEIKQFFPNCA